MIDSALILRVRRSKSRLSRLYSKSVYTRHDLLFYKSSLSSYSTCKPNFHDSQVLILSLFSPKPRRALIGDPYQPFIVIATLIATRLDSTTTRTSNSLYFFGKTRGKAFLGISRPWNYQRRLVDRLFNYNHERSLYFGCGPPKYRRHLTGTRSNRRASLGTSSDFPSKSKRWSHNASRHVASHVAEWTANQTTTLSSPTRCTAATLF